MKFGAGTAFESLLQHPSRKLCPRIDINHSCPRLRDKCRKPTSAHRAFYVKLACRGVTGRWPTSRELSPTCRYLGRLQSSGSSTVCRLLAQADFRQENTPNNIRRHCGVYRTNLRVEFIFVAVGTTIGGRPYTDPYERVYAYGSYEG